LDKILESNQAQYKKATPFPHVVIDNLFSDELLNTVLEEIKLEVKQYETDRF